MAAGFCGSDHLAFDCQLKTLLRGDEIKVQPVQKPKNYSSASSQGNCFIILPNKT